ncbi:hypothetical protein Y1Q_0022086 [Alligator mississippiensis]|uniref:ribonuclease H n=1 Tax=Alligator mississippiensis TaxID=8496 RepID=A0A151NTT1_ALLMI|nr:hypothetical protein Y1Q_0022086 [Alligator mississippiensis]
MPKMTKDDDPEAYIEAFERHALMTGLDKRFWASQLGALVVGKAQAAYQALSRDDALDYEHMKEAILYRLEINPEHYRCQFQAKKGPEAKQPRVLLQLLQDLLDKWKIQNQEGWLGEIEASKGSADETDGVDLSDLTSSLLFREAQEEDPEIGALREQAQDYRCLNAMAVFDAFPMPHVAELIERIGDARYISTLDLAKGYWQIPVAKRSRLKTAFGTPWGLYEFVRMPFGLHGAATMFQRLMDQILAGHAEYAAAYIHDIIIYTRTWEQHKSTLWAILTELRRTGLTANPQKCALAQKETKYLGFLVGRCMIKPLTDKVETIRNFTVPQD